MSINVNFGSYFVVEIDTFTGKETRITQKYAFQGDAMKALRYQKPNKRYHYKVVSE